MDNIQHADIAPEVPLVAAFYLALREYYELKRREGITIVQILYAIGCTLATVVFFYFTYVYVYTAVGFYKENIFAAGAKAYDILVNFKNYAVSWMNLFVSNYYGLVESMKFKEPTTIPSQVAWNASVVLAMIYMLPVLTGVVVSIPFIWLAVSVLQFIGWM
jgi:hypothetical protein